MGERILRLRFTPLRMTCGLIAVLLFTGGSAAGGTAEARDFGIKWGNEAAEAAGIGVALRGLLLGLDFRFFHKVTSFPGDDGVIVAQKRLLGNERSCAVLEYFGGILIWRCACTAPKASPGGEAFGAYRTVRQNGICTPDRHFFS